MEFHENTYLSWYFEHTLGDRQPVNLYASGVAALDPARYPVPPGETWELIEKFEAAVAGWLGVPAEEVVYTPGATGANLLALLTLVRPDQEVLVEQPVYEPMLRQAARVARVRRLRRRFDDGWRLPLEDAERFVTERTGAVMITEPHNPSGALARPEDISALAGIAAAKGALLVINEVYRGYADRSTYHGTAENIVVVSSLSKLFGTYSMRLGWASAPKAMADRLRVGHMNMSVPTAPAAGMGLSVMERAGELHMHAVKLAREGHSTVKSWVDATDPVHWHEPSGTGYGCVRLPPGLDDVEFAEELYSEDAVLVIPGTMFEVPGTLRIAWLQAGEGLEEGLDLLTARLARRCGG
jgi:aspartate/methionine/tyrosine aminotransferase